MNFDKAFKEFSVFVYGNLVPYNEVLSKARCRIFYKYFNRNGTYITDEFAEKLLSTITYAPIKGIYEEQDYSDHGKYRDQGKIYGLVPENHNFAWEEHLDDDGVMRTYACVDVLLYTGIYKEASEIINKPQSMELYAPSIKGSFQIIEGKKVFVYEDGCFLGLQVLGADVEPCFEGASFFTLYNNLTRFIEYLEQFQLNYQNDDKREDKMALNFKLSDREKFDALWQLLNPNYNEEGDWTVEYSITDIYDDYAIVYNYDAQIYERVYYTKEEDSIVLGDKKRCYIVDVTESEKSALETIQKLNGGTYEKIDENYAQLQEENSTYVTKIEEHEATIATLNSEKENFEHQQEEAQTTIASLNQELDSLKEYKLQQENNEKQAVITKYTKILEDDVINKYSNDLDKYTVSDLEKELAFELVQSKPNVFSNEGGFIPKPIPKTGIEGILERYKK